VKPELKQLLGRRIAPLLIVAGAVGLVLVQIESSRTVDVICNLSGLERPPERLLILAVRNGHPLRRVELNLGSRGAVDADGRTTVSFELSEGPVQLTLQTRDPGEAPQTRAVGLLEIGEGRHVVIADLRRGRIELVRTPE
jgi:hypothetical protein